MECAVCQDILYEPTTFPCGHSICIKHFDQVKQIGTCPTCRCVIPPVLFGINTLLRDLLREKCGPEYLEREKVEETSKKFMEKYTKYRKSRYRRIHLCIRNYLCEKAICTPQELVEYVSSFEKNFTNDELFHVLPSCGVIRSANFITANFIRQEPFHYSAFRYISMLENRKKNRNIQNELIVDENFTQTEEKTENPETLNVSIQSDPSNMSESSDDGWVTASLSSSMMMGDDDFYCQEMVDAQTPVPVNPGSLELLAELVSIWKASTDSYAEIGKDPTFSHFEKAYIISNASEQACPEYMMDKIDTLVPFFGQDIDSDDEESSWGDDGDDDVEEEESEDESEANETDDNPNTNQKSESSETGNESITSGPGPVDRIQNTQSTPNITNVEVKYEPEISIANHPPPLTTYIIPVRTIQRPIEEVESTDSTTRKNPRDSNSTVVPRNHTENLKSADTERSLYQPLGPSVRVMISSFEDETQNNSLAAHIERFVEKQENTEKEIDSEESTLPLIKRRKLE